MADNTQPTTTEGTAAPQDQVGPTENEMPDAAAIEQRIQSGEARKDAEAAFGGQSDDAKSQ